MANSKIFRIEDITDVDSELSLFINDKDNFVIIIDSDNEYISGIISFDLDDAQALISELKLLIKNYKRIKCL
jgi:hypothetical protein